MRGHEVLKSSYDSIITLQFEGRQVCCTEWCHDSIINWALRMREVPAS